MSTQALEDFRQQIEDYWDKCERHYVDIKDDNRWQYYINDILPKELEWASQRPLADGSPRLPQENRDVLVLLVGFQIEPLLQAVCSWNPEIVVLVLNQVYGNDTARGWGNFVKEIIVRTTELLKQQHCKKTLQICRLYLRDDINSLGLTKPANVFRCLRKESLVWDDETDDVKNIADLAQKHGKQLVFDITGGKKSMVAGAYLFSAYADVDVSYVDFDDDAYKPRYGKPYGDACQIGLLENPYQLFGLRDWQRVEELYRHFAFKAAREEVGRLLSQMNGAFTTTEIVAAERLRDSLCVYELWDRGDYYAAHQQASTLNWFTPPKVISALHCDSPPWPNIEAASPRHSIQENAEDFKQQVFALAVGTSGDLNDSFYRQERLLYYAEDELARSRRMIKRGEYRAAFLRAYSVYEVLIKARLVKQLVDEQIEVKEPFIATWSSLTSTQKKELAGAVRRHPNLDQMMNALSNCSNAVYLKGWGLQQATWNASSRRVTIKLQVVPATSLRQHRLLTKFWCDPITNDPVPQHSLLEDTMTELRHQIAHFCLWVPENMAKACLECANTNLSDFKTHWLTAPTDPRNYEPLSWKELCQQCGLNFML